MRVFCIFAAACLCVQTAFAQEYKYTDAKELTMVSKLIPTQNPYHRIETDRYDGFTSGEATQCRQSAGIAIAFRTNSNYIGLDVKYTTLSSKLDRGVCGFDLYIRKDGQWIWAWNNVPSKVVKNESITLPLLKSSVPGWKECLLYLPLQSELAQLQIVTDADSVVEPLEMPFKGRIAVFGSSFTQGASAERPGLTYSAQLSRMTGYHFINMGFCGNSKLQPYFADALLDAEDVDAYVFDAFLNPTPQQVEERLFPFIEKFQARKPGIPLIFIKTLYREKRNFNPAYDAREQAKMDMADSLMTIAVSKYPNVYWIETTNTVDGTHEWTADGSHPSGYGYHLMAKSLLEPLKAILSPVILSEAKDL